MKQLVVGDIHGCYGEFLKLLDKAGFSEDDEIIALGDIVDRGPDTPGLLEFFYSHHNVCSIMGNHERKHIRSYQGLTRAALSQMITRRQLSEDGYRKMIDFIKDFPVYIELDDALLIHGLYEPGLAVKKQKETVLVGTMSGEAYFLEKYHEPWYQLYDGDKPVIAGHHDYFRSNQPLVIRDKVFLIDTGCCHGGTLTGVILPDFRIISVECKHDYWSRIKKQYADIRLFNKSDEKFTWEQLGELVDGIQKQDNIPDETNERLDKLKSILFEGEEILEKLYRRILEINNQILADLKKNSDYDRLSPTLQGRLYAQKIKNDLLAPFLHLVRKGELTREKLKRRFKTPGKLIEFYRTVFR